MSEPSLPRPAQLALTSSGRAFLPTRFSEMCGQELEGPCRPWSESWWPGAPRGWLSTLRHLSYMACHTTWLTVLEAQAWLTSSHHGLWGHILSTSK